MMMSNKVVLDKIVELMNFEDTTQARIFCTEIQSKCNPVPSFEKIGDSIQQMYLENLPLRSEIIARRIQGVEISLEEMRVPLSFWLLGDGPFQQIDLLRLIDLMDGVMHNQSMISDKTVVVIGRNASRKQLIELHQSKDDFIIFTQEDFLNWVFFHRPSQYFADDAALKEHPGLKILGELGFKWPSTIVDLSLKPNQTDDHFMNDISDLRAIYGYSVAHGVSESARKSALKEAIQEHAIGLKNVAYHIAMLVRLGKMRKDGNMARAILRWEADLAWLKSTYYDGSKYDISRGGFSWPSTKRKRTDDFQW